MDDLVRILGHCSGTTKAQRIRDAAGVFELGESTVQNTLLRVKPFGDSILIAMYGEAPANMLHPDWLAEPQDWGPITPPGQTEPANQPETVSQAAPPAAAAPEPEAAIPPPPATIAPPAEQPKVFVDLSQPQPIDAAAIAKAVSPVVTDPIAAAIDLLRDKRSLAVGRFAAAEIALAAAHDEKEAAGDAVARLDTAIEVLEAVL
jgi:hypothetical protein